MYNHSRMLAANLRSLEFDRVLELVAAQARTGPGRRAVFARRPATALDEAERLQGELAEMTRFYHAEGQIPLAGLVDPEPILARETLELEDSWQILRSIRATQALRETLTRLDPPLPRLQRIASAIPDLGAVVSAVGRFYTKDGKLREEASAELRSIRTRMHQKRTQIQRALEEVLTRHADALQEPIVTIRGDRYVVPVRAERRGDVPGILHGRSGSGASFFIEPMSAVELNNDLADLLIQEREEIVRIMLHIAHLLLAARDEILDATLIGGELDAIQAAAITGSLLGSVRPAFSESRALRLLQARHPLLDERLADLRRSTLGETGTPERVIPTTIELTPEKPALVISGPNAGGKTVALKAAGLLTAMALAGLPLPAADGSIVPIVDDIHVLIGDDQSVMEHLSTFSADLVRLGRMIARATDRSLVLLDELGSGTDPEEGGALAAAVIEHVLDVGSLLVVTTHLAAVKSFAVADPRVANASMEFDGESGRPTFRMLPGVPGRSRAIEIASMMGMPRAVVDRAREKLGGRYGDIDQMVGELQKGLAEVVRRSEELSAAETAADERQRALERELAALAEERKKLASKWRDEMDSVRAEVSRNLQAEIRRLRELDKEERKKEDAKKSFEAVTLPIDRSAPREELAARPLQVGDRAEHRMLRFTGDILSIDGTKVTLAVAGKKMQASLDDLRPAAATAKPKSKAPRERGVAFGSSESEPEVSAELNLIGRRVDDAIDEVEKFLDQALLAGRAAVRLVHGHGTGALRNALREQLRKHRGVRSQRPGNPNEGGDGATIVFLDV
ncbi:MAG TPA: Smr/MutS family protein [Thermoanaerobaculia bacterium]|nr:Smr/MutS family protein [Thermoanaerobaculia bacterium]